MCLSEVKSLKALNNLLKSVPTTIIKVYKIVVRKDGEYYPLWGKQYNADKPYEVGENTANTSIKIIADNKEYMSGFHFWTKKNAAERNCGYLNSLQRSNEISDHITKGEFEVITCMVNKEWVTTVGLEKTVPAGLEDVIVAKKAIFPRCKEK